jgi:protein-S-isoprenylcysteine O-methyltransferase Ste14
MNPTTLRTIISVIFFFNGIGHVLGILPALGVSKMKNWSSHSWLLSKPLGESVARIISIVLFVAVVLCSIGAGLAVNAWLVPHAAWRALAIVSAVVSLVALVLFWNAFPTLIPTKVGAIGQDILVIVCLLLANWPAEADIGF